MQLSSQLSACRCLQVRVHVGVCVRHVATASFQPTNFANPMYDEFFADDGDDRPSGEKSRLLTSAGADT